ncbi:hypothetical protein [Hyphomonas sp.]|uniref:hypothetical protein n=1 Tax=Hyphomonas sp. TaxID=87 RepID=UPI0035612ACA
MSPLTVASCPSQLMVDTPGGFIHKPAAMAQPVPPHQTPALAFALLIIGTTLGIAGTDLVLPAIPDWRTRSAAARPWRNSSSPPSLQAAVSALSSMANSARISTSATYWSCPSSPMP